MPPPTPTGFRSTLKYADTMGDRLAETIETVRQSVIPRPEERRDLEAAVTHVLSATEAVVGGLAVDADVVRVGSTARDTWLRGERDIDIFVRFPPGALPRTT